MTPLVTALLALLLILLIPILLHPTRSIRYLRLKKYQLEVTFAHYMLTPRERFVLNSIFFLVLSMVCIAAALYLPDHIVTMSRRAWFYYSGYPSSAAGKGGMLVQGGKGVV